MTPAAAAGVEPGDVVLAVNDREVCRLITLGEGLRTPRPHIEVGRLTDRHARRRELAAGWYVLYVRDGGAGAKVAYELRVSTDR